MFKRIILHPFTYAIFPVLALLAHNITEVDPRIAVRSTIISLIGAIILLLLIFLISRNWEKAALSTTLIIILFFVYGQVYEVLQKISIYGVILGRHRYLVILFILAFLLGLWLIFGRIKNPHNASQLLNLVGIFLLIYPTYQIINHMVHTSLSEQRMIEVSPINNSFAVQNTNKLPDVYFIVLDAYSRGDALLRDFSFDNSSFLQDLRGIGFFVADCSRANYVSTHGSLTATLNMNYLPALREEFAAQGFTSNEDLWILIKQSKVRSMLESMGYKTVAFESAFDWSRLQNADVYLKYTGVPYEMQVMQPFEAMLIRSTGLLIWSDSTYKSLPDYKHTIFGATNFPFEFFINQQLFILDQLPHLASFPGPKFVFAHIIIPHLPFVFKANGDVQTDTGFYSKDNFSPIDEEHIIDGYTSQIAFLNSRMINILQTILDNSDTPPIIILMGDHGLNKDNRQLNLNAYYLPGDGEEALYSTITPVNSFRVIFDTFFNTDYGLLPDDSYNGAGIPVPEIYPECIQK